MTRIPRIVHYCFGFDKDFGGKPWSLVHYVCVRSAVTRLRPEKVFVHYEYEPKGVWWEQTRKIVTSNKIVAPRQIFGNDLLHPAHRADVVRLETLLREGGIYLDSDVLVHRDFDGLLDFSAVLGREGTDGLCNAVILSEPNAPFLAKWHDEFRSFRSKGRDEFWAEHAVHVPYRLSKLFPNDLTVLPNTAFHSPLWTEDGLKAIYELGGHSDPRSKYANHLWESHAWRRYLADLTPGKVRSSDSPFHQWARPFVADLPDHFGEPALYERVHRDFRHLVGASATGVRRLARSVSELTTSLDQRISPTLMRLAPRLYGRRRRKKIFARIYSKNAWGTDNRSRFFSGGASRGEAVDAYVQEMARVLNNLSREKGRPITIVDLGCGDFNVGRELLARIEQADYIGCDVVPELIEHNTRENSEGRIRFQLLDVVTDPLPNGDVCIIRHMFQHLSNEEIQAVLGKLAFYQKIYVTDGYPAIVRGGVNPDISAGFGVRYDWKTGVGRGIDLDQPPFKVHARELFSVFAQPNQFYKTFEIAPAGISADGRRGRDA